MRARIVRRMAKPDKPSSKPPIIDVNDSDQVIRLALAAVFSCVWMARGQVVDDRIAPLMATYADQLMRECAAKRDL